MNERKWFRGDIDDAAGEAERSDEDRLWTRRSALALTAGFFAIGSAPAGAAGFVHRIQPRADLVVISKRNRVLELKQGATVLRRYKIHLGFEPEGHKTRAGDGRTPEGFYFIDRRNPRSDYYLSIGISYPNLQDVARARAMGVDPGGDIFIHGEPTRGERRRGRDWTAGCIAVRNREIEEIWSLVPTGTPVQIFG